MAEDQTKTGMWCHIEIPVTDHARAKAFYSEVFGWTFQDVDMPGMKYTLYFTGEGGIGGGFMIPPEGAPKQIVNYILVDEIEPALERISQNGGKTIMPKQEVPQAGWFAIAADPDGNSIGIWKSAQKC